MIKLSPGQIVDAGFPETATCPARALDGYVLSFLSTKSLSRFGRTIVRRREFIALLGSAVIRPLGAHAERPLQRILYFTHSAGYRHDVIPLSKAILAQLGSDSGAFEVTET